MARRVVFFSADVWSQTISQPLRYFRFTKELAASGIRVNTLVPGPTNTPMMQGIPQEWSEAIIKGVPMGRMAEPDDIARVALFLASDDAGFVTGQNLAVNGGSAFL